MLPQWVEASAIEVATRPETASDGQFWRENVVIYDPVAERDTEWVYEERLRVGTYYVHVRGYDNSCFHTDFQTDCGFAWSNVMELTISPEDDAPLIVLNKSIGYVRLVMSRQEVESFYGAPAQRQVSRRYFPPGTHYYRRPLVHATYRLHRGILRIGYVDGRVKTIQTTSRYYRTKRGIGVGTRLPLNRCRRLDWLGRIGPSGCKARWGSFVFDGACADAWLGGTRRALTILFANRGQIESVLIGDPDVILYCF